MAGPAPLCFTDSTAVFIAWGIGTLHPPTAGKKIDRFRTGFTNSTFGHVNLHCKGLHIRAFVVVEMTGLAHHWE